MGDLTMTSFAYLRTPLVVAGIAFLVGAVSLWLGPKPSVKLAGVVVMMVLFFHAARLALVVCDPYLSSRPLAEALNRAPHGRLILDDQYYTFSSVIFYAEAYHGERALLLNGRVNNLEYGSYAPGVPRDVFIDDAEFRRRWLSSDLYWRFFASRSRRYRALERLLAGARGLQRYVPGGRKRRQVRLRESANDRGHRRSASVGSTPVGGKPSMRLRRGTKTWKPALTQAVSAGRLPLQRAGRSSLCARSMFRGTTVKERVQ